MFLKKSLGQTNQARLTIIGRLRSCRVNLLTRHSGPSLLGMIFFEKRPKLWFGLLVLKGCLLRAEAEIFQRRISGKILGKPQWIKAKGSRNRSFKAKDDTSKDKPPPEAEKPTKTPGLGSPAEVVLKFWKASLQKTQKDLEVQNSLNGSYAGGQVRCGGVLWCFTMLLFSEVFLLNAEKGTSFVSCRSLQGFLISMLPLPSKANRVDCVSLRYLPVGFLTPTRQQKPRCESLGNWLWVKT